MGSQRQLKRLGLHTLMAGAGPYRCLSFAGRGCWREGQRRRKTLFFLLICCNQRINEGTGAGGSGVSLPS